MTFAQAKILFLALGCFITVRLIRDRIRRRKRQPRAGEADVRPMTPQPAAPVVIPAAGSQPPTQAAE
jgi:DNA-directed RNA polymerase specialized sigma24 family protein